MINPLKFIQEVKQETFRITWPTKKETMMGAVMVFALASIAAIFFLILDQILLSLGNRVVLVAKFGGSSTFHSVIKTRHELQDGQLLGKYLDLNISSSL